MLKTTHSRFTQKWKLLLLLAVAFLLAFNSWGTERDSIGYGHFRMLRVKQENDLYQYWYQSDKDFTNGFHVELFHEVFDNKVSDFALIGFKRNAFNDFSLCIGQDLFTPEDIDLEEVDSTDRPYAALLYLTYAKFSNDFFKGRQLNSNFYIGISGEYAFGEDAQNGIHEIIDNKPALGWGNQIGSSLMLDYDLRYKQLLPLNTSVFESNFFTKAHVGTIYNYFELGFDFKIGHYTDSYLNDRGVGSTKNKIQLRESDFKKLSRAKLQMIPNRIRKKGIQEQLDYLNDRLNRNFQFYFQFGGLVSYNLYDGTSEGSLISFSKNVYELEGEDLNSFLYQGYYGFSMQYNRVVLSYYRFLSNNIKEEGALFGFGEITFSYSF